MTGVIPKAELELLSTYLSGHTLSELSLVLEVCAPPMRKQILREVCGEAEAFGDRALILALARVDYAADHPQIDSSEASG